MLDIVSIPPFQEALRAANPVLATRTDKQRLKQLVGTIINVPVPQVSVADTTTGGLGPLNCANGEVMISCSTDSTCQNLGLPSFGCIPESQCISLYELCLTQNPGCPSCCIKCKGPNPEAANKKPVGYYLLTFNDGSAHCDPWSWW